MKDPVKCLCEIKMHRVYGLVLNYNLATLSKIEMNSILNGLFLETSQ